MDILLVLPNCRSYVIQPSLGLGYLASCLRKEGHKVFILDMIKERFWYKQFRSFIKSNNYEIVGFYMSSHNYSSIRILSKIIKEELPGVISLVGGPHPTGDPQGILTNFPEVDYVMQGYSEISLPKLVRLFTQGTPNDNDLYKIEGLGWRDDSGTIQTKSNNDVFDLDKIDFPSWDLMRPDTYPKAPHGGFIKQFPYAPIIITRGCPMSCTFCAGANKKVMKRSISNVMEELRYLTKNFGVREILLEDENITLYKDLCREFCEALLKEDAGYTWTCASGVRLDTLNREDLKLMERAGCHSLSVGIEFGSQRIHDLTKKRLNLDLIKQKLAELSTTNIRVTGFFLMGIPGETEEEMRSTVDLSLNLKIHRAQFNNFMPLPGSEIWQELEAKGELAHIDFDKYFVHDVSYTSREITATKLKKMQRQAYLRFYLRWRIIKEILKDIKSAGVFKHLLIRLFDALKY